jgi:hypothetical protein
MKTISVLCIKSWNNVLKEGEVYQATQADNNLILVKAGKTELIFDSEPNFGTNVLSEHLDFQTLNTNKQ